MDGKIHAELARESVATRESLLSDLHDSLRQATEAIAHGDVAQLEQSTATQQQLLRSLRGEFNAGYAGDSGAAAHARNQREIYAALALHASVLARVVQRCSETASAMQCALASGEPTYAFLLSKWRP